MCIDYGDQLGFKTDGKTDFFDFTAVGFFQMLENVE